MHAACAGSNVMMAVSTLFAVSASACAITLAIALRSPLARSVLDQPNRANAMHAAPTPRIGGLAIWIACLAVALIAHTATLTSSAILLAFVLVIVSFIDDHHPLPALPRLLSHAVAAIAFVWLMDATSSQPGTAPWPFSVSAVVAVFALVWLTNLYNFMDGADGLAGGMALFGFGAYAIAASHAPNATDHATAIASISAILSGAALGFLFFNFPPAKVFMGDAGSIPLGFLAAALGLQGMQWRLWDWWFPLLVFSPFIVDATVTLIKRIARLKRIWEAHREHYYHRLILGGWSHRRTALSYYALMLACSATALYGQRELANPAPILAFWVVTYAALLLFLEWRFKVQNKNQ